MASMFYFCLASYILANSVVQVDSYLRQYISVVSDVHKYYRTSGVFFVISRNDRCFEDYTSAYSLTRDFSRNHDITSIFYLDQLDERIKWYHKKIGRSLLVIFLRSLTDLTEFVGKPMSKSHIWLVIFSNDSSNSPFCEYCTTPKGNGFRLRFDTQMLVLCCDSLVLKEWRSIDGDHTEVSDFAVWANGNRDKITFHEDAAMNPRRSDIKGMGLRIGLVGSSLLTYEDGDGIQGLFGDILTELKRSMNFTITGIVRSPGFGNWNSQTKSWTGAIGQLVQGEADLGVADFTITSARLEVLEYTLPLAVSKCKLYIRDQGDTDGIYWAAYFQAFSVNIWIVTIFLIILAALLVALIKMYRSTRSLPSLIVESYLSVWGIFCQQGLSEFPGETSLRIAYFSIFILALIIYSAYAASLVSFLTISPSGLPFRTLEGFANDGSYGLIVYKNNAAYEFFANSTDPVLKKMMKLMKPVAELPETSLAGWDQVCHEKVALFTNDLSVIPSHVNAKCKVTTVDSGYEDTLAMVMPVGSQYSRVINYHIQSFKDTGVLDRIKRKYYDSTYTSTEAKFDEFNIWDVAPVLATFTLGIILATLVLVGEIMHYTFGTNSRNWRCCKNSQNISKTRPSMHNLRSTI